MLRWSLRCSCPTPLFQALPGRFALACRTQQDFDRSCEHRAGRLQWFLSESRWDPKEVNERRLELLLAEPTTAANKEGVLVIDEHGDRKWGKHTAHVGKQWLGNIGKTENGVVSVSSLSADEGVYTNGPPPRLARGPS